MSNLVFSPASGRPSLSSSRRPGSSHATAQRRSTSASLRSSPTTRSTTSNYSNFTCSVKLSPKEKRCLEQLLHSVKFLDIDTLARLVVVKKCDAQRCVDIAPHLYRLIELYNLRTMTTEQLLRALGSGWLFPVLPTPAGGVASAAENATINNGGGTRTEKRIRISPQVSIEELNTSSSATINKKNDDDQDEAVFHRQLHLLQQDQRSENSFLLSVRLQHMTASHSAEDIARGLFFTVDWVLKAFPHVVRTGISFLVDMTDATMQTGDKLIRKQLVGDLLATFVNVFPVRVNHIYVFHCGTVLGLAVKAFRSYLPAKVAKRVKLVSYNHLKSDICENVELLVDEDRGKMFSDWWELHVVPQCQKVSPALRAALERQDTSGGDDVLDLLSPIRNRDDNRELEDDDAKETDADRLALQRMKRHAQELLDTVKLEAAERALWAEVEELNWAELTRLEAAQRQAIEQELFERLELERLEREMAARHNSERHSLEEMEKIVRADVLGEEKNERTKMALALKNGAETVRRLAREREIERIQKIQKLVLQEQRQRKKIEAEATTEWEESLIPAEVEERKAIKAEERRRWNEYVRLTTELSEVEVEQRENLAHQERQQAIAWAKIAKKLHSACRAAASLLTRSEPKDRHAIESAAFGQERINFTLSAARLQIQGEEDSSRSVLTWKAIQQLLSDQHVSLLVQREYDGRLELEQKHALSFEIDLEGPELSARRAIQAEERRRWDAFVASAHDLCDGEEDARKALLKEEDRLANAWQKIGDTLHRVCNVAYQQLSHEEPHERALIASEEHRSFLSHLQPSGEFLQLEAVENTTRNKVSWLAEHHVAALVEVAEMATAEWRARSALMAEHTVVFTEGIQEPEKRTRDAILAWERRCWEEFVAGAKELEEVEGTTRTKILQQEEAVEWLVQGEKLHAAMSSAIKLVTLEEPTDRTTVTHAEVEEWMNGIALQAIALSLQGEEDSQRYRLSHPVLQQLKDLVELSSMIVEEWLERQQLLAVGAEEFMNRILKPEQEHRHSICEEERRRWEAFVAEAKTLEKREESNRNDIMQEQADLSSAWCQRAVVLHQTSRDGFALITAAEPQARDQIENSFDNFQMKTAEHQWDQLGVLTVEERERCLIENSALNIVLTNLHEERETITEEWRTRHELYAQRLDDFTTMCCAFVDEEANLTHRHAVKQYNKKLFGRERGNNLMTMSLNSMTASVLSELQTVVLVENPENGEVVYQSLYDQFLEQTTIVETYIVPERVDRLAIEEVFINQYIAILQEMKIWLPDLEVWEKWDFPESPGGSPRNIKFDDDIFSPKGKGHPEENSSFEGGHAEGDESDVLKAKAVQSDTEEESTNNKTQPKRTGSGRLKDFVNTKLRPGHRFANVVGEAWFGQATNTPVEAAPSPSVTQDGKESEKEDGNEASVGPVGGRLRRRSSIMFSSLRRTSADELSDSDAAAAPTPTQTASGPTAGNLRRRNSIMFNSLRRGSDVDIGSTASSTAMNSPAELSILAPKSYAPSLSIESPEKKGRSGNNNAKQPPPLNPWERVPVDQLLVDSEEEEEDHHVEAQQPPPAASTSSRAAEKNASPHTPPKKRTNIKISKPESFRRLEETRQQQTGSATNNTNALRGTGGVVNLSTDSDVDTLVSQEGSSSRLRVRSLSMRQQNRIAQIQSALDREEESLRTDLDASINTPHAPPSALAQPTFQSASATVTSTSFRADGGRKKAPGSPLSSTVDDLIPVTTGSQLSGNPATKATQPSQQPLAEPFATNPALTSSGSVRVGFGFGRTALSNSVDSSLNQTTTSITGSQSPSRRRATSRVQLLDIDDIETVESVNVSVHSNTKWSPHRTRENNNDNAGTTLKSPPILLKGSERKNSVTPTGTPQSMSPTTAALNSYVFPAGDVTSAAAVRSDEDASRRSSISVGSFTGSMSPTTTSLNAYVFPPPAAATTTTTTAAAAGLTSTSHLSRSSSNASQKPNTSEDDDEDEPFSSPPQDLGSTLRRRSSSNVGAMSARRATPPVVEEMSIQPVMRRTSWKRSSSFNKQDTSSNHLLGGTMSSSTEAAQPPVRLSSSSSLFDSKLPTIDADHQRSAEVPQTGTKTYETLKASTLATHAAQVAAHENESIISIVTEGLPSSTLSPASESPRAVAATAQPSPQSGTLHLAAVPMFVSPPVSAVSDITAVEDF